MTAAREIKLLQSMDHPNIVKLRQICASSAASVYLVFEYLDYDLSGLLQHPSGNLFSMAQVKCIIYQLLQALLYLHSHGVVHRDLKGSNVLLSRTGQVKLAAFGLAKIFHHPDLRAEEHVCTRMMTNRVITIWYRPPEILLGSTKYGSEVDMWGVGCILLELLYGKAVFTGQDEISQLETITRRLGSIPRHTESMKNLPWFVPVLDCLGEDSSSPSSPSIQGDFLSEEFGDKLGAEGLDLVRRLLSLDPTRRINAKDALQHHWFNISPHQCASHELLPNLEGDWHEYECKQRNRRKRDQAPSLEA